ncbi:MAG: DUF2231 domain-containing protein [Aquisalimonadaceae bacterium]
MTDPLDLPAGTHSQVAVAGHPIHPMLITFPVAFYSALLASDIAYLVTEDLFWAQVSVWLAAAGSVMGLLAGIAGTVELLMVRGIRLRPTSWSHFVASVLLLSIGFINWAFRIPDSVGGIYPWGIYLSGLGVLVLGVAGWLGGHLVFHHQIGVVDEEEEEAGARH